MTGHLFHCVWISWDFVVQENTNVECGFCYLGETALRFDLTLCVPQYMLSQGCSLAPAGHMQEAVKHSCW